VTTAGVTLTLQSIKRDLRHGPVAARHFTIIYIYICMYVYMCIYIYVYIYRPMLFHTLGMEYYSIPEGATVAPARPLSPVPFFPVLDPG
jgi:hypothetical protein